MTDLNEARKHLWSCLIEGVTADDALYAPKKTLAAIEALIDAKLRASAPSAANVWNALADGVEALTDEEILAEAAAKGIDANKEAERVRAVMLAAVAKARNPIARGLASVEQEAKAWPDWKRNAASAEPHIAIPEPSAANRPGKLEGSNEPDRDATDTATPTGSFRPVRTTTDGSGRESYVSFDVPSAANRPGKGEVPNPLPDVLPLGTRTKSGAVLVWFECRDASPNYYNGAWKNSAGALFRAAHADDIDWSSVAPAEVAGERPGDEELCRVYFDAVVMRPHAEALRAVAEYVLRWAEQKGTSDGLRIRSVGETGDLQPHHHAARAVEAGRDPGVVLEPRPVGVNAPDAEGEEATVREMFRRARDHVIERDECLVVAPMTTLDYPLWETLYRFARAPLVAEIAELKRELLASAEWAREMCEFLGFRVPSGKTPRDWLDTQIRSLKRSADWETREHARHHEVEEKMQAKLDALLPVARAAFEARSAMATDVSVPWRAALRRVADIVDALPPDVREELGLDGSVKL